MQGTFGYGNVFDPQQGGKAAATTITGKAFTAVKDLVTKGKGLSVSVTIQLTKTNADTVEGTKGGFKNAGVSAGAGIGAGYTSHEGTDATNGKPVQGSTVSVGIMAGAGVTVTDSNTVVSKDQTDKARAAKPPGCWRHPGYSGC
jgi:hypothetical protein